MQGWILRRCLSNVNRICGRTYRPKEPRIRELCAIAGVEWPEPPPRTSRSSKEPHSESDLEDYDEELESDEEYTDDEEVPGFSIFISKLFNDLKKIISFVHVPLYLRIGWGMSLCQVKMK